MRNDVVRAVIRRKLERQCQSMLAWGEDELRPRALYCFVCLVLKIIRLN